MADSYLETLERVFHPTFVKVAATVVALVGIYDTFSNQFSLPKLGRLLGMSGSLLPWWGWLLILQSVFVAALFEYIRRNVEPKPAVATLAPLSDAHFDGLLNSVEIKDLTDRLSAIENRTQFPSNLGDTLGDALLSYEGALNSQIARIRELVEKASEKLGNSHNEAVHLLDYCISTATRSVCRVLLAERPRTNKLQPPLDANVRNNAIAEMRMWLQKVRQITSIAAYGAEIDLALRNGLQQAAEMVRQIPPAQRPRVIDPLAFHDYYVPAQQCEFVAQCLSYVIRELNRADRDRLERLREAFSVRSPRG